MRATVRQHGWLVVAYDGTELNLKFPLVIGMHHRRKEGGEKRVVSGRASEDIGGIRSGLTMSAPPE